MRRNPDALLRSRARKEKDDAAERLRQFQPKLKALKLEISEIPNGGDGKEPVAYLKHVMVDHAPARFELPCHNHKCDGAHNFTRALLHGLKAGEPRIEGSDRCGGTTKEGECPYEMTFVAHATYA